MKQETTAQAFRIVLIFSLITLGINVGRRLIFNASDLGRVFSVEIFTEIVLELIFGFITGIIAYYLTKPIRPGGLGISLLKAFIFSVIYGFASFAAGQILFSFFKIGFGSQFDMFQSVLNFVPYGFMLGILFVLVVIQLSDRTEGENLETNSLLDG